MILYDFSINKKNQQSMSLCFKLNNNQNFLWNKSKKWTLPHLEVELITMTGFGKLL